jgi:hypothetical protein
VSATAQAVCECGHCVAKRRIEELEAHLAERESDPMLKEAQTRSHQHLLALVNKPVRLHLTELVHGKDIADGWLAFSDPQSIGLRLNEADEKIYLFNRVHVSMVEERTPKGPTLADVTAAKDQAYSERNRCVAALALMAKGNGWPVGLARHPEAEVWEDDWRNIVWINLPSGQVTWHLHDSELPLFDFLTLDPSFEWDGHTTEEKYRRLAQLR